MLSVGATRESGREFDVDGVYAEHRVNDDECGLKPKLCNLLPKQPKVNDERYAYFMLQREG